MIGQVTDSGRLVLDWQGETVADIPVDPLVAASPGIRPPHTARPAPAGAGRGRADAAPAPDRGAEDPAGIARFRSKRWIWEQYDHLVMGETVIGPGGDAALIRVPDGAKGLAITLRCTPRYCRADPETGGAQAVAEAYRNICATGATPLAVTNNLNFGNPERPEIMGELVGCVGAWARPPRRSPSRSSPAMSRSTTRPTARRSCRPR